MKKQWKEIESVDGGYILKSLVMATVKDKLKVMFKVENWGLISFWEKVCCCALVCPL